MNPAGAGRFLLYVVVVVIYFFWSTAVTTGAHKVYSSTDFYIEFLILDLEFEEIHRSARIYLENLPKLNKPGILGFFPQKSTFIVFGLKF